MQLTSEQRAYQVRVNRAHGVRPSCEELDASKRSAYVAWWGASLDARDALRAAKARERQALQDAALLPKPSGHEPRKRIDQAVMVTDSDAYPATVLLDRRVSVKVNPSSRRSVRGGRTGYEAIVTRPNGAHLHGKPVSKGQVMWVPLSMLDGPQVVAEATPAGARAKRNAGKRRAKQTAQAAPAKPAAKPVTPKAEAPVTGTIPPKVEKAIRDFAPTQAVGDRAVIYAIMGHNNVSSK